MSFAPVLNSYCTMLGCSNKELAERCGLSMSALSRYRNGKRSPRPNSGTLDRLAEGISQIAQERGIAAASSKAAVKEALAEGVIHSKPLGPSFSARVDSVMKLFGIKNVDVAIPMHLDSSYISRIRRGERTPNDKRRFAEVLAQIAALACMERGFLKELSVLLDAEDELSPLDELDVDGALGLAEHISRWLLGNQIVETDVTAIEGFFEDLDRHECIDLLEGELKLEPVLSCPVKSEPMSRFYVGGDLLWKAEMDFLENAATCGAENLFLSSDMPAFGTDISDERTAVYRRALMELINRGCNITVVHDPNRPLKDSIAALRLWMPLYMTGHVTPLYMEGSAGQVFSHVNNVCECCALVSEAIRGHEESGRYYITSLPEDLEYYHKKMGLLLDKTFVLLEIYRSDDEEGMQKFKQEESQRKVFGHAREVRPGYYENLRIVSYKNDCVVLYLDDALQFRFVVRHPKIRYIVSQMT